MQPRLHMLEEQRTEDKAELATKREELLSASKEIARLKELVEAGQRSLAETNRELSLHREAAMQLEVEKEVRSRAETREEMERHERISACAQLLATQSDCSNRIRLVEEKSSHEISSLRDELSALQKQREEDLLRNEEISEKAAVLEGQISQYKLALENAAANHETVAELGQVKAELEIMRRRVVEINEVKLHEHSAAHQRIAELEAKVMENDVQRRKLHNLVQELRGNVRVFARVRPFLPSDEVDGAPESTILTRHDNAGVKIVKKPQNPDDKLEEHSFVFDKSFEQSASQVGIVHSSSWRVHDLI